MAKFCTRCGKQCLDNAMICPGCGQMLSASGITYPNNSTNMNGNANGFPSNSMGKQMNHNVRNGIVIAVAIGCVALFAGLILIAFMLFNSKGPTEKWIKDNLSEDVYVYELDYEEHTSTLSDIEIINSYQQADTYYVDFKVLLEDEYLCRELVFHYSLAKQGVNDWVILSNELDKENSTVTVQLNAVKKCADTYLTNLGYKIDDDMYITSDIVDDDLYCEYNINESYEYFEAKGLLVYDAYLVYDIFSCPQSFILNEELDVSAVNYEWKIAGTWEGESDGYRVVMNIIPEGDHTYSWNAECFYDNIYGEVSSYTDEGVFKYGNPLARQDDKYYAPGKVQAFQSFWIGYPWCVIGFYSSDAVMHIGKNTEDSPFTRTSVESGAVEGKSAQEIENTTSEKQEAASEAESLFIKYDGIKISIPCTMGEAKKQLGEGMEERVDDEGRQYYGLYYDGELMFFSEIRDGQTEEESQPHSIQIDTKEGLSKTSTSLGVKGKMSYEKAIASLKKKGIAYEDITDEEGENERDIVVYQGNYRVEFTFEDSEMVYICITDVTYESY